MTGASCVAQATFLIRYDAIKHDADTKVYEALRRLDGTTAQASAITTIHNAGHEDGDQLGHT